MAKALASRAHSDEALQERLERAAARFSSIHARWAAVTTDASLAAPASERSRAGNVARGSGGDLALPVSESGVCVTPILGIAAADDDEPRPRFKTLMGVPRDEADADAAGSEVSPSASAERASSSSDTARLKKPTPPPLPDRFLTLPEAAPSPSRVPGAPSLLSEQATRQTLPPATTGTAPQPAYTLAPSSPDTAAGVAGQRRSQRRRSWLVGVGSFAATLAVFAIAAPRERALAARWLRNEYQARVQPSLRTVADSARALQPTVVEPVGTPSSRDSLELVDVTAEMRRIDEGPLSAADSRPDPAIRTPPANAAPAMEVVSKPASELPAASGPLQSSVPSPEAGGASASADGVIDGMAASPPAPRRETTAFTQAKSQVAAPRKRSTRATSGRATSAETKPRGARATKERAARQNSPRRGSNGGIIRETPF